MHLGFQIFEVNIGHQLGMGGRLQRPIFIIVIIGAAVRATYGDRKGVKNCLSAIGYVNQTLCHIFVLLCSPVYWIAAAASMIALMRSSFSGAMPQFDKPLRVVNARALSRRADF
jgi:hypothetical protein